MKWIKILITWLLIIPLAILNGGFREYILNRYLNENISLALSGIVLSILIFFVSILFLSRIRNLSKRDCLITGLLWMILTICFEFHFGLSSGSTLKELLLAYNPLSGNLWLLVLLSTLISPIFAFSIKLKNKTNEK